MKQTRFIPTNSDVQPTIAYKSKLLYLVKARVQANGKVCAVYEERRP